MSIAVPPRILIVDDDQAVRDMLALYFQEEYGKRGYLVETHPDGAAALQSATRHRPALVLLDIDMPGLDGVQTLRRLKALHPTAPVIMITGNESTRTAGDVIALGAFSYVPKPVKLTYLTHLVAAVLPPAGR